jgi:phage shock protein C
MREYGQQTFRRGSDRILGGVCSGIAAGFHVDPLWVRLAFVILAFFQGIGLFLYIVLWLVMPEKEDGLAPARSGFDSMTDDLKRIGDELRAQFGAGVVVTGADPAGQPIGRGRQTFVLGLILVLLGGLLLAVNTRLVTWTVVWPVAVIALGTALLVGTLDRKT